MLGLIPQVYVSAAIGKLRPSVGFYLYIIKKRRKKVFKVRPYYMPYSVRWQKSMSWIRMAISNRNENKFYLRLLNEVYLVLFYTKGFSLALKTKHYKIILLYKSSKHYKW